MSNLTGPGNLFLTKDPWDHFMETSSMYPTLDEIEMMYTKSDIKEMIADFWSNKCYWYDVVDGLTSEEMQFMNGLDEWYENL